MPSYYKDWIIKTILLPQSIIFITYSIVGHVSLYNNKNILYPSYKKVILNLFFNFILSTTFGICLLKVLPLAGSGKSLPTDLPLPNEFESLPLIIYKWTIAYIISQLYFYFSHRLFHTKYLFKYIHYIHHEAINVYPLVANYCHPLELLLVNLPSTTLGVILTQMSWKLSCIWYLFFTIHSMMDHYKWIYSEHHNKHHEKMKYNYSTWPIIDKIFGTFN